MGRGTWYLRSVTLLYSYMHVVLLSMRRPCHCCACERRPVVAPPQEVMGQSYIQTRRHTSSRYGRHSTRQRMSPPLCSNGKLGHTCTHRGIVPDDIRTRGNYRRATCLAPCRHGSDLGMRQE
jgi:hypothetical protein